MRYRFEFLQILAIPDLVVLRVSEEGRAEASDYSLGIGVFNCERGHLHF